MGDNHVSKKIGGFARETVELAESTYVVESDTIEFDTTVAKVNDREFEFLYAKSSDERYQGLSDRESLDADGMLFEYPRKEKHRLVFRSMNFPLDVLFLDEDGNIVDNGSLDEENPATESVCLFALEVEKGWINENDISLADSFDFSTLEKQSGDWEPYEGPQGGFGWRNTENNEVVYQEEPPGEPDLSALSGEQIEQLEEALGEDLTEVEETPESAVDVSVEDIGYDDYAYIGEEEGFVDSVDRVGDDAYVEFEDGTSFWVGDKEVYVDDEPTEQERQREFGETLDRVDDSIEIESTDSRAMFIDSGDVRETIAREVDRTKDDTVTDNLLNNLETVERNDRFGAHYNPENQSLNLPSDTTDATASHELGHAILGENGFEPKENSVIFGRAFIESVGNEVEPVEHIGKDLMDFVDEMVTEGVFDMETKQQYEQIENVELSRDVFMVDNEGDTSEAMDRLAQEVNNAWEKQIDSDDRVSIGDRYSASSAHETMARLHENLQAPGINYMVMEEIVSEFPELLDAYLEIFEPNESQQKFLEEEGVL